MGKGYWQERFKQMEEAQNDISIQKVQEIQEQFERAQIEIEKKINMWYYRFADNNGVSMVRAKQMLSSKELKELQWNVQEYIKHGKENAITGEWEKELENASARIHIRRWEALKLEVQQEMEKLYGNLIDSVDKHIKDVYTKDFFHTAFEIQKGTGIGYQMQRLDANLVDKIVHKPWAVDGKNFSERLWEDKVKLINNVHNSLSKMCITGAAPDKAIAELANKMKVSRSRAGNIIMTESAVFANKARQESMIELGVEEYEIVETLDGRTCSICADMDGKHFKIEDFQIGVTAPVFHPRCRGCTCPYFDDEYSKQGKRAARDEEGETYYVSADITYKEWKKSFVDGDKLGLKEINHGDTIKNKTISKVRQSLEVSEVEYKQVRPFNSPLTTNQIIERLSGGDMTKGSCSSLAFAYIGNKNGLNVLDFRGGKSQTIFATNRNIIEIANLVNGQVVKNTNDFKAVTELLKNVIKGKEYYLSTGQHAAIIRKTQSGYEYLELQSAIQNGFKRLTNDVLKRRFRCKKTHSVYGTKVETSSVLIDSDSLKGNQEFEKLLGYINTSEKDQLKGVKGNVK